MRSGFQPHYALSLGDVIHQSHNPSCSSRHIKQDEDLPLLPDEPSSPTPSAEASSREYGHIESNESCDQWVVVDGVKDEFPNRLVRGHDPLKKQMVSIIRQLSLDFDIKFPRPLQIHYPKPPVSQRPYYAGDPFGRNSAPHVPDTERGYRDGNVPNWNLLDFAIYERISDFKYDNEARQSLLTSLGFQSTPDWKPPGAAIPPMAGFIQLAPCERKAVEADIRCSDQPLTCQPQWPKAAAGFTSRTTAQQTKRSHLRQLILPQRVAITEALAKQSRPGPPRPLVLPTQLAKRDLHRALCDYQPHSGPSGSSTGVLRLHWQWHHFWDVVDPAAALNPLADVDNQLVSEALPIICTEEEVIMEIEDIRAPRLSMDWEAELINEYLS